MLSTGRAITLFLMVKTTLGFARNSSERDRQSLIDFQRSFVQIQEMYRPIRRKGLKLKRDKAHPGCLQRVLQIRKKLLRTHLSIYLYKYLSICSLVYVEGHQGGGGGCEPGHDLLRVPGPLLLPRHLDGSCRLAAAPGGRPVPAGGGLCGQPAGDRAGVPSGADWAAGRWSVEIPGCKDDPSGSSSGECHPAGFRGQPGTPQQTTTFYHISYWIVSQGLLEVWKPVSSSSTQRRIYGFKGSEVFHELRALDHILSKKCLGRKRNLPHSSSF